ncbi:MAG: hypothetical protein LUE10_06705 [Alistipes sp.]|nr:hypothetical protein [Alistipes sp.]
MNLIQRYRGVLINLLTAVGISLIANFNFFLMRWMPAPPGGYRGGAKHFLESDAILYVNFFYYLIFALVLLTVLTANIQGKRVKYFLRALICIGIAVVFYFISPVFNLREGTISLLFSRRSLLEPSVITKISFTLIISVLYGKIFQLIY